MIRVGFTNWILQLINPILVEIQPWRLILVLQNLGMILVFLQLDPERKTIDDEKRDLHGGLEV